jgi:hypothetical protein
MEVPMWNKLFGAVFASMICCGVAFAAPATTTQNSANTQLAENMNGNGHSKSCGCNMCNFCDIGCSSCEDDYFSAHVDWLYWKARRGGLDFGILNNGSFDDLSGKCCEVCPDRDHGVRVGLLYKTCDCWDIAVEYTYWQTDDSATCYDGTNDVYFTRVYPSISGAISADDDWAHSRYEIDFHMLDIVAGYSVEAACDVTVRPFAGLRFTFMDQDLTTKMGELVPGDRATLWESVDMDAYGFVAGVDMDYKFWDCFSIFGRIAGMVAYADFDVSYVLKDISVPADRFSYTCGCDRVISMLEASVGFQWTFCETDCGTFFLALGWEMQSWHNMADFANFDDNVALGSTSRNNQAFGVEGLFVRIGGQY